jgi:hypothetical protein
MLRHIVIEVITDSREVMAASAVYDLNIHKILNSLLKFNADWNLLIIAGEWRSLRIDIDHGATLSLTTFQMHI